MLYAGIDAKVDTIDEVRSAVIRPEIDFTRASTLVDRAEIEAFLKLDILIKVVAQAVGATERGQLEMAEKGFASLNRIAESEHASLLRHVKPLALLGLGLIRAKQGNPEQARSFRDQAVAAIDEDCMN